MLWKSLLGSAGAFVAGSAYALYLVGPPLGSGPVRALDVTTAQVPLSTVDKGADSVGRLHYLGGIEIRSEERIFGGISAIQWEPACGRLLGVTDTGSWVVLAVAEKGGRLLGLKAMWTAPLLDEAGDAARSKRMADAEAIVRETSGDTLVWFELDHRAQRYQGVSACRPESLATAAAATIRLPQIADWPENGGVEAATSLGETIVLLSEAFPGEPNGRAGLLLAGDRVQSFNYQNAKGFDPTAMDTLDASSGTVLVLSRRFDGRSVAAVVEKATVSAGQTGKPEEIAKFATPLTLDNMEGLAIRTEGDRTFVYLVSDDNFNPVQRTLLLKFELLD